MTVLRCTAKLLKRLKQPAKPPEPDPQTNPLGEWYADLDVWRRQPFVVLLNAATGAVLVLPGNAAGLRALHANALLQYAAICEHFGLRSTGVDAELAGFDAGFRFASTRDRSLLTSLNQRKTGVWLDLEHSRRSLVESAARDWTGLFAHPALGRNARYRMDHHVPLELIQQRLMPAADVIPLRPRNPPTTAAAVAPEREIAMTHASQLRIPATYMRGGTSKGVFFCLEDLPAATQVPGPARDALMLRVIGSPDPYAKHTDGMGGATSSTSKCVIIAPASVPDHDVDYLYGQVSIDSAFVDWSGNCGNLSTAVGPFAIANGFIDPARIPRDGTLAVRVWQANIGKTIIVHVPVMDGQVQETGDFELDGVTFPAAEIVLEFLDPADEGEGDGGGAMFPTGHLVDNLEVPGVGTLRATLINVGIPTIFIDAASIGYTGTELQDAINGDAKALAMFETIRAHGAVRMGLIGDMSEASKRQHTPKIAFVAPSRDHVVSSGKAIVAGDIDLLVRALSMGKLHHAMMGTAAVAIGTAAAIPGTLVNLAAGGGARTSVRFGHPSGTLRVGAEAVEVDGQWSVAKAIMSRSARVLMEGAIRVPGDTLG